jgi:hypothetical protein
MIPRLSNNFAVLSRVPVTRAARMNEDFCIAWEGFSKGRAKIIKSFIIPCDAMFQLNL